MTEKAASPPKDGPALAGEAVRQPTRDRADARDRRNAERDAGQKNAVAAEPATQAARREPKDRCERQRAPGQRSLRGRQRREGRVAQVGLDRAGPQAGPFGHSALRGLHRG